MLADRTQRVRVDLICITIITKSVDAGKIVILLA